MAVWASEDSKLQAVHLSSVLHCFGRLLGDGAATVPKLQVDTIDVFISASATASRRQKFLCSVLHFNLRTAGIVALIIMVLSGILRALFVPEYKVILSTHQDNTMCDEASWPDKDHNLVCGECKVLVDHFDDAYGSCNAYCAKVGRQCVGAWEEVGDSCNVKYDMTCDQSISSSDAICQCGDVQDTTPGNSTATTTTTATIVRKVRVETCNSRKHFYFAETVYTPAFYQLVAVMLDYDEYYEPTPAEEDILCASAGILIVAPVFLLIVFLAHDLKRLLGCRGKVVYLDEATVVAAENNANCCSREQPRQSMGTILKRSTRMFIIYDEGYLNNLKTVYEVGCFLSDHKPQDITVIPVFLPTVVFGILVVWQVAYCADVFVAMVWVGNTNDHEDEGRTWFDARAYILFRLFVSKLRGAILPLTLAVFLRIWAHGRENMRTQLKRFYVGSCECMGNQDRQDVNQNIARLMLSKQEVGIDATEGDSLDAFNGFIRKHLWRSMKASISPFGLAYGHVVSIFFILRMSEIFYTDLSTVLRVLADRKLFDALFWLYYVVLEANWAFAWFPLLVAGLSQWCGLCLESVTEDGNRCCSLAYAKEFGIVVLGASMAHVVLTLWTTFTVWIKETFLWRGLSGDVGAACILFFELVPWIPLTFLMFNRSRFRKDWNKKDEEAVNVEATTTLAKDDGEDEAPMGKAHSSFSSKSSTSQAFTSWEVLPKRGLIVHRDMSWGSDKVGWKRWGELVHGLQIDDDWLKLAETDKPEFLAITHPDTGKQLLEPCMKKVSTSKVSTSNAKPASIPEGEGDAAEKEERQQQQTEATGEALTPPQQWSPSLSV